MTDEFRMTRRYTIDGLASPAQLGRIIIPQIDDSEVSLPEAKFRFGQIVDYSVCVRANLRDSKMLTFVCKIQRIHRAKYGVSYDVLLPNGNCANALEEHLSAHKLAENGPKYTQQLPFL